jgi:hypothetical protein
LTTLTLVRRNFGCCLRIANFREFFFYVVEGLPQEGDRSFVSSFDGRRQAPS